MIVNRGRGGGERGEGGGEEKRERDRDERRERGRRDHDEKERKRRRDSHSPRRNLFKTFETIILICSSFVVHLWCKKISNHKMDNDNLPLSI